VNDENLGLNLFTTPVNVLTINISLRWFINGSARLRLIFESVWGKVCKILKCSVSLHRMRMPYKREGSGLWSRYGEGEINDESI